MAAIKSLLILTALATLFVVVKLDECDEPCTEEDTIAMFDSFETCQGTGACKSFTDQSAGCQTCGKEALTNSGNKKIGCMMDKSGFAADDSKGKKFVTMIMGECKTYLMPEAKKRGIIPGK